MDGRLPDGFINIPTPTLNFLPEFGYSATQQGGPWPGFSGSRYSGAGSTSSESNRSYSPSLDNAPRKVYDTWSKEAQKLLVQLWAENFERLESKDARKTWQKITDELNNRLGSSRTSQKCNKKIKYLIDRYKDAKDWNSKQSGGNLKKSPFYDEIDAILGCRDLVTLPHVVQAGVSTSGEETEQKEKAPVNKQDARSARKKTRKRQRLEERDEEEQNTCKEAFQEMKEQRSEMKEFMKNFHEMQRHQVDMMNNFLGAMTQFMQQESNNAK